MVAVLPLTQAAGTGNPVHYLAINALAAWVALVVTVVTGLPESAVAARGLTALALAGAVSFTAVIGADGVWNHPYRTQPRGLTTESVPGVSALDGVKLGPDTAARYADLHQRLAPWIEPPGRAIMAFDELSGVVLLLDGRPVGEGWYSAIDHERTAAGIRAECRDGNPWWGSRAPILLFNRPVTETELAALRSCGLDFASDYRLLAAREETLGLEVYVPID